MNELTKKIIAGAVTGFLGAFLVDVDAWKKADGSFNYKLAAKRWLAGAVSGALAGLGMGEIA